MNQNLKRILMCAVLMGLPFASVRALNMLWYPHGDGVITDANGDTFATTGGNYIGGDYLGTDAPESPDNLPFTATSASNDTLDISGTVLVGETPTACPLKINGNVVLDATAYDMTVNINTDVKIEPYFKAHAGGPLETGCSQLYFNTGAGFTTTINVLNNLEFDSKTTTTEHQDLLITFAGRGQVVFSFANGKSVKFNGQIDTANPQTLVNPATLEYSKCPTPTNPPAAGGTKVFIIMDQTVSDNAAGLNKVLFKRANQTSSESQRVLVEVGPNSIITYLSDNDTGIAAEVEDPVGYGTIAFDPTNDGIGRMVLLIRGAYHVDPNEFIGENENPKYHKIDEKYLFNDGAVVVCGHYVSSFDPDFISGCAVGGTEAPGVGYDFSKPAGIRAIMRVIKNTDNPTEGGVLDPRGLLVVNDVVNHGKLFSDPYWDLYTDSGLGYVGVLWAPSNPANAQNNVRHGYVVGVNGRLEVVDAAFVDYAAGGSNFADPLAFCDFADQATFGDPTLVKRRNPAAFIIDGLDSALFDVGNPLNSNAVSLFEAANPFTQASPVHAEILLNPTAKLFWRSCASSQYGYLKQLFTDFVAHDGITSAEDDPDLDWTASLILGTGTYDGRNLSPNADTVQSGEGVHVFDVEGPVSVTGGTVNMASVLLNFEGNEMMADGTPNLDTAFTLVDRPLLADGTVYTRYNSPTMFFNNHASFFDNVVAHTDATKYVDGIPTSDPAITGGERLYFANQFWTDLEANVISDPNRYRLPELQFFNSELQLHENCNASGVRFVVRDIDGTVDTEGNNTSIFRFYDHGDPLDTSLTGFGRVMLFGSSYNTMDDGSNNFATESCCLNVYKHNRISSDDGYIGTPATITLSLANGNEFHPDVQTIVDTMPEFAEKQRAHHLVMFAQPTAVTNQPGSRVPFCHMAVGWGSTATIAGTFAGANAPAGDANLFPGSFPYPEEPRVTDGDSFTSMPFSIDALDNVIPPATVSIDGSIMCFGSFNEAGKSILVPADASGLNNGVAYIKHGGKITTTRPDAADPIERNSIPNQSVFSTMLCQRIWNDYDFDGTARVTQLAGIIDLPHDQVTFEPPYGVQPYNITHTMFDAARSDITIGDVTRLGNEGYVRLSFENDSRTPARDRSGAEEVSMGWFFREAPALLDGESLPFGNENQAKVLREHFRKSVPAMSKALTRATESLGTPVTRPTDLLYIGAGDDVVQMKVYGATMSDPFVLDVSGDNMRPNVARVREFVSAKSTRGLFVDHFISEGAHALLFVEFGGRIGLGSRAWNENSVNAWNLLGKDYVSICPLGAGVVDVNSNLIVTDRQALIATDTFGLNQVDRLVFYAEHPYEIRIPSGQELDLSAFGQAANRQEVSFAGKVKLVVEDGATIRMPDAASVDGGLVLYFNDEAQLVFEGREEGSTFLPYTDAFNAPSDVLPAPISESRTRLMGAGQLWFSKNASMRINGNTFVGVETDSLSPTTDITISLIRQSQFFIGDENVAGGAFQVGNASDQADSSINFTLSLNGPRALFHIDREGFFGLGAGVINKWSNPNGSAAVVGNNPVMVDGVATLDINDLPVFVDSFDLDASSADPTNGQWQIQRLYNVDNVTINMEQGAIEHKNIADGSDSTSSLMAFGQAGHFVFNINGPAFAEIRGGGNIAYIPDTATASAPIFANVWDYAGPLSADEQYSIFVSGPVLLDRRNDTPGLPVFGTAGLTFETTDPFTFFSYMAFPSLVDQPIKKVDFGSNQFDTTAGFANASAKYTNADGLLISRIASPATTGAGAISESLDAGALGCILNDAGDPAGFTIIQSR